MRMPAVVHPVLRCLVAVPALVVLAMGLMVTSAHAQSSSQSTQSTQGGESTPNPVPGAGASGGGAFQDWGSLMMLIQQTVDPDDWRDVGGENSMIPYRNGVWMDAKGHIKRMQRDQQLPGFAGGPGQLWRAGSGLRTVSLKALDAAVGLTSARGLVPTNEMCNLAGITHIQYIAVDKNNRDILIAGPAAKGHQSAFLLEDLRELAAVMNRDTEPMGCSLDPNNDGIVEAYKFLSDPAVVARLGRAPQMVADQLKAKVGSHTVNIYGLDPASSTAFALVDADEHMKRVGLGLESTTPKIKTYFDQLDRKGAAPAQSLIRWWFAYNPAAITVNASNDLFEMPENAVAVMSEQQWMNARGQREATGSNDEAADAFAAEMTAKMRELAKNEPEYARLLGIFEMGLAIQVSIEASGEHSLAEWFPNLCHRSRQTTAGRTAPKSVDGVTAWDRLKNGTVVAVISGGVKLEPGEPASKSNWQSGSVTRPTSLAAKNDGSAKWWWD